MSLHRISPRAGRADVALLPRGPNGRCLCRECGQEVPPRRRTFCGDACVDRWKLKTDPSYLRKQVYRRDRGRCAGCGLDCKKVTQGVKTFLDLSRRLGVSKSFWSFLGALKVKQRSTFWDADHRLAVADGGGECDLTNMQTLCIWCHREKSAARQRSS